MPSASSASTAAGTMPASRTSKARSSHASTAGRSPSAPYFGQDVQGIVDRLLTEQMADGGWNCEQENGSTRGSFHSTICVLEGLLEHELDTGGTPEVTAARHRGQEYLLERRMLRRLSTGEVIDADWTRFSFPTDYYYDVLRGLELPAQRRRDARWPRGRGDRLRQVQA